MKSTTPPLKERLIKTVLSHLDGQMRVINLQQMTEEILSLLSPGIDWAEIDPVKWGELREQGDLPLGEGHG